MGLIASLTKVTICLLTKIPEKILEKILEEILEKNLREDSRKNLREDFGKDFGKNFTDNFAKSLSKTFVIYIGSHGDKGAQCADVVLPAAAFSEKESLYMNFEGRVQSTYPAFLPPHLAREDWKILRALSQVLHKPLPFDNLYDLRKRLCESYPIFSALDEPPAFFDASNLSFADLEKKFFSDLGEGVMEDKALSYPIQSKSDFYLTNPIARASQTMAKCAKEFSQAPITELYNRANESNR